MRSTPAASPTRFASKSTKAGNQLIRIHDSPQPRPEVLNVQGPAAAGSLACRHPELQDLGVRRRQPA